MLIALVLGAIHFFDLIDNSKILSSIHTDIAGQFYSWRSYAIDEIKSGRCPHYNPYLFGGFPFIAGTQTGIFYPLHLAYLIFPINSAIDFLIVIHLLIGGITFFNWARYHSIPNCWAALGGIIWSLSGVVYPHVYAGHLPNINSLAWIPLCFHMVDKIFNTISENPLSILPFKKLVPSIFALAFGFSMILLGGHIQYLYYLILCLSLYILILMFPRLMKKQWLSVLSISSVYLAALVIMASITAIQWVPTLFSMSETLRSKLTYEMASTFSFPIENILTLLLPYYLGDNLNLPYWGRHYLWEMQIYFGIIPAIALIFGVKKLWHSNKPLILISLISLFLALGSQTFLFDILYMILPGFSSFRGTSKFTHVFLITMLILSLKSIVYFLEEKKKHKFYIRILLVLSSLSAVLAVFFLNPSGLGSLVNDLVYFLFQHIQLTGESYFKISPDSIAVFIQKATSFIGPQLFFLAIISALMAISLAIPKLSCEIRTLILIVVTTVDILLYTRPLHVSHKPITLSNEAKKILQELPPEARLHNPSNPNIALMYRYHDLWGLDPFVFRRYAEYVTYSLGLPADRATQYLPQRFQFHSMHAPLRLYGIADLLSNEPKWIAKSPFKITDEAFLVSTLHIEPHPTWILSRIADPEFRFDQEAVIEKIPEGFFYKEITPNVPPSTVEILNRSPGKYHIRVEAHNPALLVISTNYSKGWRAYGLPDSAQYHYTPIPANYTFLSLPINPGSHNIILEYISPGWNLGIWISTSALILLLTAILIYRFSDLPLAILKK
ncbi:MAG: YfhO family protein [Methylacidiphilales bacterium]|nr:YfhO family protein [Candidatus Methylacidiphilales bacterium]